MRSRCRRRRRCRFGILAFASARVACTVAAVLVGPPRARHRGWCTRRSRHGCRDRRLPRELPVGVVRVQLRRRRSHAACRYGACIFPSALNLSVSRHAKFLAGLFCDGWKRTSKLPAIGLLGAARHYEGKRERVRLAGCPRADGGTGRRAEAEGTKSKNLFWLGWSNYWAGAGGFPKAFKPAQSCLAPWCLPPLTHAPLGDAWDTRSVRSIRVLSTGAASLA